MKINIRKTAYTLALVSCLTLVTTKVCEECFFADNSIDIDNNTYAASLIVDETEEETDLDYDYETLDESDSFSDNEIEDETSYEVEPVITDPNLLMIVPGVRVTSDGVNIRKEANTDCDIISIANENDVFKMISKYNDEWYKIKYDEEIAYINAEFVEETDTIDSDIKDVRYMNENGSFYDLDGNYIGDLEQYECVEVYGEKDDKYFVSINGNIGYVSKDLTSDLTDKCAVVDISSQTLTLYDSNEKILTTPVVTGKDSSPSDIGLFDIDYKMRDTNLTDGVTYDVPVDYWMPYNDGEGIHDSTWRDAYGGEIYHYDGSHGCINTPYKAVSKVYDTLETGSHVLVKH